MRWRTLGQRSLRYHWREQAGVFLGVVVGSAVLTGALLVGDALRGSLRAAALDRLGRVTHVVRGTHCFSAALGERIQADEETQARALCPALLVRGSATHAESRVSVAGVDVCGVDDSFWRLGDDPGSALGDAGAVVLNEPLAEALHAGRGDEVVLRVPKVAAISPEFVLGRANDVMTSVRVTVGRVVPPEGLGGFSLVPGSLRPRVVFVPLRMLQRALHCPEQVNTLLIVAGDEAALGRAVQRHMSLADAGLKLRVNDALGYLALESDAFLLTRAVEDASREAARGCGVKGVGVLAYLANSILVSDQPDRTIPYSIVVGLDPSPPWPTADAGRILLNDWSADQLGAQVGDAIHLEYYVSRSFGERDIARATFGLAGVVPLAGPAADPGFTPAYAGVTDTRSLTDWDPPFPIDLKRIRSQDEDYWDQYGATPKAFVALADAQRLWAADHERFGRLTSLRVYAPAGRPLVELEAAFARGLLDRLPADSVGLRVDPIRERSLAASMGSTDFAGLFLGFSFFLIVSAALLVALLHRLHLERRVREIGLLLALGFTPGQVARWLWAEGAVVAVVGAAAGLCVARGYAWLMLVGLRTWWSMPVTFPPLRVYAAPLSYVGGFAASVIVAAAAVAWSLRGFLRRPARSLLVASPDTAAGRRRPQDRWVSRITAGLLALSTAVFVVPSALSARVGVGAFFIAGSLLLMAALAVFHEWLQAEPRSVVRHGGARALLRLGARGARRNPTRSLLTTGLFAATTFTIASLEALRADPSAASQGRASGNGGFALLAESTVPIVQDLNSPAGRAAAGVTSEAEERLKNASIVPFRLRAGDDASCLNLYRPTEPRMLGVPDAMLARGGFAFAASPGAEQTPWELLRHPLPEGVIPAIADEATARWQLHVELGGELPLTDEQGRPARLRLVGFLRGSVLQGALLIAEADFARLFPSQAGYGFFLIDTQGQAPPDVARVLESELLDFGFGTTSTRERLADLRSVQNTYLSAFQALGGIGLLLGSLGLAVVLLRNVWERQSELALLRTLGFSSAWIGGLLLAESAVLVATGLLIGLTSAAVAIAPHVVATAASVRCGALLGLFAGILAVGLLAGGWAIRAALRAPLLATLRRE